MKPRIVGTSRELVNALVCFVMVLTCAAVWLIGLCVVMGSTSGDSLTQNSVDPAMRARVTSVQAMISVGLPSFGYGIRYEFVMFSQSIPAGAQVEHPDS